MSRVTRTLKAIGASIVVALCSILIFVVYLLSFFVNLVFLVIGIVGLLLTGIGYEVCMFFGEVLPKYGKR